MENKNKYHIISSCLQIKSNESRIQKDLPPCFIQGITIARGRHTEIEWNMHNREQKQNWKWMNNHCLCIISINRIIRSSMYPIKIDRFIGGNCVCVMNRKQNLNVVVSSNGERVGTKNQMNIGINSLTNLFVE